MVNANREDKEKADKSDSGDEKDEEVKAAINQGMTDVSSPGASSSHQAAAPSAGVPGTGPSVSGKRTLEVTWNDD